MEVQRSPSYIPVGVEGGVVSSVTEDDESPDTSLQEEEIRFCRESLPNRRSVFQRYNLPVFLQP